MNNDVVTYELTGFTEVIDALEALTDKEIYAIVRSGIRKGLQENVVKPVRAAIPYSNLKRSVGIVAERNKDEVSMYAGVTITKTREYVEGTNTPRRPDGVILRWLEFGTAVRTTKAGANRGAISPKSMITPVIEGSAEGLIGFLNNDFETAVDKFLTKKLKKMSQ